MASYYPDLDDDFRDDDPEAYAPLRRRRRDDDSDSTAGYED